MTAPDPLTALREYVAAQLANARLTNSHEEGALLNEAPALLAYVERLEAALRPFADIGAVIDEQFDLPGVWLWKRQSNVRDEPGITAGDCRRAAVALGREIKERKP